jgi:SAM-dependent MidA family methyltransferase
MDMDSDPPLAEQIRREIAAGGPISFARFMELALYAPGLGYYERSGPVTGAGGDFCTSVSVGPLFGELLAFEFAHWAGGAEGPRRLVEAGAHDGRLAADLLGWLRRQRPQLDSGLEYWILEPSARRQEWQRKRLAEFAPRVRWAGAWAGVPAAGYRIIFSNELLDAMPVHRLGWDAAAKAWFEWGVTWEGDQFGWARLPLRPDLPPGDLQIPPELLLVLPDGYTLEVGRAAERWWRQAAAALGCGRLVALDYGLTREEWPAPHRPAGTLRAFHRHQVSADLLANPGEQDLTAHVNFAAIQRAGEQAGLKTEQLVSQERFLTGVAARAWAAPESFGPWTPAQTRQFQTLARPDAFGRAFQVLVQSRSANPSTRLETPCRLDHGEPNA